MKFDLQNVPAHLKEIGPRIGDVYRMKGGRKGGGYWVIIGQTEKMSVCLGLDDCGQVVSSTNYYTDVMDRRDRVGFVQNIDELTLSIVWE